MGEASTIAQIIVAGGMAGARPALTLFALQLFVALFAAEAVPVDYAWLVSVYAITAVGIAALVEHFARTDPELDELLALPNAAIGAAAATLISGILVLLGTEAESALGASSAALHLALAGFGAEALDGLPLIVVGAVLSVVMSLLVGWTRRQLLAALDVMAVPGRLVRWLETGSVIGALALVLLVPVLAVALAVLLVVASSAVALVVRGVERRRDRVARRPCGCGYMVRNEASVCPSCGEEREPTIVLGKARDGAGSFGSRPPR
jgi:hypothetical protein